MWNQYELDLPFKVLFNFPFVKRLNMFSILKMKKRKRKKNK
jgi:hypothetical protein